MYSVALSIEGDEISFNNRGLCLNDMGKNEQVVCLFCFVCFFFVCFLIVLSLFCFGFSFSFSFSLVLVFVLFLLFVLF
jgi:hypothetical protein